MNYRIYEIPEKQVFPSYGGRKTGFLGAF